MTKSTNLVYTFFTVLPSKRLKYGQFKKVIPSHLGGNGKVNEIEKETMSDRTAWLWLYGAYTGWG